MAVEPMTDAELGEFLFIRQARCDFCAAEHPEWQQWRNAEFIKRPLIKGRNGGETRLLRNEHFNRIAAAYSEICLVFEAEDIDGCASVRVCSTHLERLAATLKARKEKQSQ